MYERACLLVAGILGRRQASRSSAVIVSQCHALSGGAKIAGFESLKSTGVSRTASMNRMDEYQSSSINVLQERIFLFGERERDLPTISKERDK